MNSGSSWNVEIPSCILASVCIFSCFSISIVFLRWILAWISASSRELDACKYVIGSGGFELDALRVTTICSLDND